MSGEHQSGDRRDAFEAQVVARLRDSADQLDAATRSRLNRARQSALDKMTPARPKLPVWGALAPIAIAVLAISLWRSAPPPAEPDPVSMVAAAPELELLLGDESLDMIEDLEFYAWLAAEDFDQGTSG